MRRMTSAALVLLAITAGAQLGHAQAQRTTWTDYGGGPDNARYLTLNQINKSNVGQLAVAWTYPTSDNISYVFSPVVVDNMIYVLARNNSLVALDATTGKEIWVHEGLTGIAPAWHQLLGEQGSLGSAVVVPDEQLPPGHRRPHRPVDRDVRERRGRQSARRPWPRPVHDREDAIVQLRARSSRT